MSAKHHLFGCGGEFSQCNLYGGFWDGGEVDQRLFGLSRTAPPENKLPKGYPHRDPGSVQQPYPENWLTDTAKVTTT